MKPTCLPSALTACFFRILQRPAKVLALLLLVSTALHAGDTILVGQPRDAGDEAAVRLCEDRSRRAVVARDYATLEQIWSERFVVNAPSNRVIPSRSAVFEIFRKSPADLYSSYEKTIECIAFDGDLAIVMGIETVTPLDAPAVSKQRRYTNVWRSAKGSWLLIARQATYLPPDGQIPAAMKVR
jgi:ketosteroid isomerase-like protein